MKKSIILMVLVCIMHFSSNAQKQKDLVRFRITEATSNGHDISQWYFERKQFLVFYENKDGNLCFANVSGVNDDQSYGRVFSLNQEGVKETNQNYKADVFSFRWKYYNTYNSKSGYATVILMKVYKPTGVFFQLRMMLPNLDVSELKGYMEGSLNLNNYLGQ